MSGFSHSMRRWCLVAGLLLAALPLSSAQEPPRPIDTSAFGAPGAQCAELRYADFSETPEATTQITDARPFAAQSGTPDYCQVQGYVWRSTPMRLRFPLSGRNGKVVVTGGGGQSGSLPDDVVNAGRSAAELRRGFATVNHDGGHFSTISDTVWAFQDGRSHV